MKKTIRTFIPIAVTAVAAIAGYLVAQEQDEPSPTPPSLAISPDSRPIERVGGAQPTSYAPMLAQARQSVVSVMTSELVQYASRSGSRETDILRQLFGGRAPQQSAPTEREPKKIPQGVGSGVIISSDGYILTNNHVIQDSRGGEADEIMVVLSDGSKMEAKLIGRDPKTDIAVIKVEANSLPAIKVADSDQIMVGDIVFAIGNPLGVGLTVTSGIISATERSIGIYGDDGYEDFIQTDAAINQGNSGGALVDIEGRLIGVNSAIASTSGGSIGLGFAIPSDLAIRTATQLTETGEVKRGLIGIRMKPLDSQIAEAMGIPNVKGVLLEEVVEGYPAKEAGLEHGDVITKINDRIVDDINDLRLEISTTGLDESVMVVVLREGKEMTFDVKVANPNSELAGGSELIKGVKAAMLNDEQRKAFRIPSRVRGLVITETDPKSPNARYLQPGLVIMEVNRNSIQSLEQAKQLLREQRSNLLYVYANGRTNYFAIER